MAGWHRPQAAPGPLDSVRWMAVDLLDAAAVRAASRLPDPGSSITSPVGPIPQNLAQHDEHARHQRLGTHHLLERFAWLVVDPVSFQVGAWSIAPRPKRSTKIPRSARAAPTRRASSLRSGLASRSR